MRAQRDELLQNIDVIHGHFVADKYLGLFPATEFIAFFRDPYQQAVSNYWYLMRHPEIDHPSVRDFHRDKPTITDFVASRPNVLSVFLGRLAVEDLAAVGITESYDRSIALMEKILGRALAPGSARLNVNPERRSEFYAIDASVREAVDLHQAGDVELYRRASERFAALVSRYDI
ncbi:hypothetical protein [uncultured Enterovirga sp.]|uniref:hypothetical protein n=1 Tax=uncultured Enterovirga sp. TaxID=2026352 RepID=UPI0035C97493